MAKVCEKCKGTGKVPKPIAQGLMGEEDCDVCDGTGEVPETYEDISKKLDRIIELLEYGTGIRDSVSQTDNEEGHNGD